MNKRWMRIAILLAAMLLVGGVAQAGSYRSPSLDTSCDSSTCYTGYKLIVSGGYVLANPGACTADLVSYIKWDLTGNASDTIGHAKLTLTTSPADSVFTTTPGTYTFALVQPNNHTWTESGANPGYGAVLATSSPTAVTSAGGQQVVFESDALGTYFNGLKGGLASVGVVVTSGCTSINHTILFHDRASGSAVEPDLIFWPGAGPTSVALAEFSTHDAAPTWPLYAGLGALALLAVVGVRLSQRRAAR